MKALIRLPQSAAGLRPLTLTASPAMVPLLGAPLLEPLILQLARTGATEITLLHECLSNEVRTYFRDGRRFGALLSHVTVEPGYSLEARLAAGLEGCAGPETVLYMDSPGWTDASADGLLAAHAENAAELSATGAAGFRLAVVDYAPNRPLQLEDAAALPDTFDWRPIATLRQWWDLTHAALRGEAPGITPPLPEPEPGVFTAAPRANWEQASIQGPVWIGPGSRLEPGAIVEGPAWIGAGCHIGAAVRLARCVVEDHTRLNERFDLADRYVVRNRAFGVDGSTLILSDALCEGSADGRDSAAGDLVRLATRVAGFRSPVFR